MTQPDPLRLRPSRERESRPPRRVRRHRRTIAGMRAPSFYPAVGAALAGGAMVLSTLVDAPYAIFRPGPTYDVLGEISAGQPVVEVDGARTYPTGGQLRFTTVQLQGSPSYPVSWWDVAMSRLDRTDRLAPAAEVFPPDVTSEEVHKQNAAQMQSSQKEAASVALRAAGLRVREYPSVAEVVPDAPAKGVLRPGDRIERVGGTRVRTAAQVQRAIRAVPAGERVALTLRRGGAPVRLSVPTRQLEGHTVVGVILTTELDTDVDVTFHAGEVGGPSAGLMFSLGLYDKLTPGEITGGQAVAGTGTIDAAGTVGPIGGIQQKLFGAREDGAEWFLAPARNCGEVAGGVVPEGLRVVRVETFDDAREALGRIAAGRGSDLPACG